MQQATRPLKSATSRLVGLTRGLLTSSAGTSAAALLLSVTLALISAVEAIRGSEIVTPPPERVLIFRDATAGGTVMWLAVKQSFINVAGNEHGDLLRRAELRLAAPDGRQTSFAYNSLLEPVMVDDPKAALDRCELTARCLALDGLLIVDRSDRLVDLAGGAARGEYLGFALSGSECRGRDGGCAAFADAASVLKALAGRPLMLELDLRFQKDGRRRLRCRTHALDAGYVEKVGWTSLACME